jgi:hypothetical protein
MSKADKMPGSGGSYVRGSDGALTRKAATKPAISTPNQPAAAKVAAGKKEA